MKFEIGDFVVINDFDVVDQFKNKRAIIREIVKNSDNDYVISINGDEWRANGKHLKLDKFHYDLEEVLK